MRTALVACLVLLSCGRGTVPTFVDYQEPTGTRIRGELRTPDDRAPRGGRLLLRDSSGQTIARADADEQGRFSFPTPASGPSSWLAVDDDGNAARGAVVAQPQGDNELGRVWLSASVAAPWLVSERGLGFEERLTEVQGGVSGGLELSGDRAWVIAQDRLNGVHLTAGDVLAQASELPWAPSYWRGLVSPSRSPTAFGDRRASGRSCPVLLVHLSTTTLVVWDPARAVELQRFEFPNMSGFVDNASRDGLVFFGCDEHGATLIRSVKPPHDGRELSVEQYKGGQARRVASLELDPGEWVLDVGPDVTLLSRFDGTTRVMRLWWPGENRQRAVPAFNFIRVGVDATGNTLWRSGGGNASLVDSVTGESVSLGDVDLTPSPNRRWLLGTRRKGELRPFGDGNAMAFFTTGLDLTRVNLASRTVERLSLPTAIAQSLARGVLNFDGVAFFPFDDGAVLVVVQTDDGAWLCDPVAGTAVSFAPERPRGPQRVEVVRTREHVVIVERLSQPGSTDSSESVTLHVGRLGEPLRRRTLIAATTETVRVTDTHVVMTRRAPLTGVMQLSRLALDPP
ncbi:MAG: hypothetical protein INH41_31045 [Myxococcaceae bacterium]|nr:hypothetical protein [Myxococcaceae bacterium]